MKILFYTDIHLSGVAPRHRTDDFPKALIAKIRETYAIAEQENCDFVEFGGDFFNTHRIFNYDIISDSLDVIGGSSLMTYACVGEHDLYGHSPETYPTSTLAFFERICPKLHIIREPVEIGDVVLYAKHEWDNIHEAMKQEVDKKKLNILVCHELITNRRAAFDIVDTASLKCPFDLVLSGDLHDGYEPHEVNGTWYCNPGSLARRTTADAGRMPQVALIEIEKGSAPVIELRQLACGRAGSEVFGESLAEVARSAEEFNGSVFAEEMMEFEAESVDVHELIQKMGVKKGLRKEVLDYLATKKVREGEPESV